MSEDVQAQLDEFAGQLAYLTAKFEVLQRQVAPAAPRPRARADCAAHAVPAA